MHISKHALVAMNMPIIIPNANLKMHPYVVYCHHKQNSPHTHYYAITYASYGKHKSHHAKSNKNQTSTSHWACNYFNQSKIKNQKYTHPNRTGLQSSRSGHVQIQIIGEQYNQIIGCNVESVKTE
ncbi:hypothetical protein RYX36_026626 [Vicia faba]